jgi:multidrug resistance efflux pump
MTAALAQAKDDLARGLADLGAPERITLGCAGPRRTWKLLKGVGDSAVANQPMLAMIDANSFYVQALFRETFVGNFQKGDRAVVTLMSYPDTPLEGSVDWGIAQQNGSTGFEQLPSAQPTFECIRLAQRIQVMVRIEKVPDNNKLREHHGLGGGHHRNGHGR